MGSTDSHIHELRRPDDGQWTHEDLTTTTKSPTAAGDPYGFSLVRNAVVPMLAIKGGDGQTAQAGTSFPTALQVLVTRKGATTPIPNTKITFAIQGDTGSTFPNGQTTASVTTGPDGCASAPVLTAGTANPSAFTVTASLTENPTITTPFHLTVIGVVVLELVEGRGFPVRVRAGSDLGYCWKITNTGPSRAHDLRSVVVLPSGVTPKPGCNTNWGWDPQTRTFTSKSYELAVNSPIWFAVVVTVDENTADGTELVAEAQVTAPSPVKPSNTLQVKVTVRTKEHGGAHTKIKIDGGFPSLVPPFPDSGNKGDSNEPKEDKKEEEEKRDEEGIATLRFTPDPTVDPNPVTAGRDSTFEWSLKNTSKKTTADDVMVNLVLPDWVSLTDVTPETLEGIGSFANGVIESIRPGTSQKITATGKISPDATGELTAWAYAGSSNATPCSKSVTVKVSAKAVLVLDKRGVVPGPAVPGDVITYTWELTNRGPSTAGQLTLSAPVPDKLSKPTLSIDGQMVSSDPQKLTTTVNKLAPAASKQVTITGTVATDATEDLPVTLTAATARMPDVSDTQIARLKRGVLRGEVALIPSPPQAGQPATYVWTIRNDGTVNVTQAALTVTPPDGMVSVVDHTGATPHGKDFVWTWDSVPSGHAVQARLGVRLGPDTQRLPAVTGSIKATNVAQRFVNATDSPATSPSALSVLGTATPVEVLPAQDITFTWTITNTGRVTATDLTVVLDLPALVTQVTITPRPNTR
jgi:uncharacterized repeat protein (TIGR01451 family)